MRCHPSLCLLVLLATALLSTAAGAQPVLTDSLYNDHHPRLLFTPSELPALRAKVTDGGEDDEAFVFLRGFVHDFYAIVPPSALIGPYYAMDSMPSLGIVAHIEVPPSPAVVAQGKALTTFIVTNYEPDYDEAGSGLRLRALALGYDWFFADATPTERALIRDEMVRYIERMIYTVQYAAFEHRPYLGNHSAMFAAALGLAAICLQGEAESSRLTGAFEMADRIVANLLEHQFDPAGSYNEGALYVLWTMRNLAYYFDARERFDGFDYSDDATIRGVEQWLPYELLFEGEARTHNLNDSPYATIPFALSTTYFDWAMNAWNSGLAAWLWDRSAGTYGVDTGPSADKVATVLWHRPIAHVSPSTVLPKHKLWLQRGLYHFRTGWQTGASSTDHVSFNFYSGKFQGAHAQEDQNQFALYAYGAKFVIDNGPGGVGKESEAHNMVFVDGKGQHNAGSSIGTDGRIAEHLLGGSADYLLGDATQAYTTHSEFNNPGVPFPGIDWSWGYSGANPVEFAHRRVLAVHGDGLAPYFVVMDDIRKDGPSHAYEWRMHTLSTNSVSTSSVPWTITGAGATLEIHPMNPAVGTLSVVKQSFDNLNSDPESTLLRVGCTAIDPRFAFALLPRKTGAPAYAVARFPYTWGYAFRITGPGDVVDTIVRNDAGILRTHANIQTDALVTWVREIGGVVRGYLAVDATSFRVNAVDIATVEDGPLTFEMSGSTIRMDRSGAEFRFLDSGIAKVCHHDDPIGFMVDNGYVVPSGVTSAGDSPPHHAMRVTAHPNPFNPRTTIRIDGVRGSRVELAIYDVAGRRVFSSQVVAASGTASFAWDGRDHAGRAVASGTYFVQVRTPDGSRSAKLTLVK